MTNSDATLLHLARLFPTMSFEALTAFLKRVPPALHHGKISDGGWDLIMRKLTEIDQQFEERASDDKHLAATVFGLDAQAQPWLVVRNAFVRPALFDKTENKPTAAIQLYGPLSSDDPEGCPPTEQPDINDPKSFSLLLSVNRATRLFTGSLYYDEAGQLSTGTFDGSLKPMEQSVVDLFVNSLPKALSIELGQTGNEPPTQLLTSREWLRGFLSKLIANNISQPPEPTTK